HLQWRDADFVPHRNAGDGNFAPCLWRTNHSIDFTGQFNSGSLTKSKAPDVFVKFLVADGQSKLCCSNVARLDQNVADAQIAIGAVIMKRGATIIPDAVLTKNLRIGPELAFVESRGSGYDLKGGTWFHHVDDGAVFHLFGLSLGAEV